LAANSARLNFSGGQIFKAHNLIEIEINKYLDTEISLVTDTETDSWYMVTVPFRS